MTTDSPIARQAYREAKGTWTKVTLERQVVMTRWYLGASKFC